MVVISLFSPFSSLVAEVVVVDGAGEVLRTLSSPRGGRQSNANHSQSSITPWWTSEMSVVVHGLTAPDNVANDCFDVLVDDDDDDEEEEEEEEDRMVRT